VVLLDFWATWCRPCVMSMPSIQAVATKYADKPVTVLGVNSDEPGSEKMVASFLNERKFTYRQFHGPDGPTGRAVPLQGIPYLVLIDKNGVIQVIHSGFSPGLDQVLSAQIDKLLKGENLFTPPRTASQPAASEPGK